MKKVFAGALAALGVASAIALAPTASADEAGYLSDLNQAGFGNYNAGEALSFGYAVCDGVNQGWTQGELINGVYQNTVGSISLGEAQFIVESAEIYLC